MISFLDYFSKANFMPHGHCYLWRPGILWLHFVADLVIALSYFSIPIMLYYFVYKKKNVPHNWIFKLFAAFIMWCGLTHLISIWTIWDPVYQIEGLAKGVTAIVSAVTAICLFPTLPKLLALRTPEDLESINKKLKQTLEEKNAVEAQLIKANETLENEVDARTKELVVYSTRLQVANTELESFAHQASHDLKSPLNNILGLLKELQESPESLERYQKFLPRMESNLNRLNHFITDILDLSKLGEVKLQKEYVDLSEIIEEAKANVFHMIEERGASIYIDNVFDVLCNRSQMVLVFQNLLENAIKYTEKQVTPEVIISSTRRDGMFYCQIKDNGIGMDQDGVKNVFDPFFRLHSEDEYPGTGLGLSICKKIIVNHGGEIHVSSELGKGSTFNFYIPLS